MSAFDPKPTYRVASRAENLEAALDMPFSPLKNVGEQLQRGALDSFGLGTAVKDFSIPRSTLPAPPNAVESAIRSNLLTSGLAAGYDAVRNLVGAQPGGKVLDQAAWKSSPYFRTDVPWDAGMTEDRAAALAQFHDQRKVREFFGQKDMVSTLVGQFAGAALDPINYVPVFGPAARIAAASKFGRIAGSALFGASEAVINTAVFGALTAPARGTFGDDVSWQAAINNIAFSAVAGAAFGAIGGSIEKFRQGRTAASDAKAQAEVETIKNLAASREALNDAVSSLVTTGEVKLTPRTGVELGRMADEIAAKVQPEARSADALKAETANVTGTKAGEVAINATGARVAVRPEVVELDTLQKATGALQVRDRSNAASAAQVEDIAINLDPSRLMPAVSSDTGAPIVGSDNIVDSGNGRVMAIGRAYEAYPERAAAYRQALADAGYDVAGMRNPVLISRRLTELSPEARAQFNAESQGGTARMSATELAQMESTVARSVIDRFADGPVTSAANRAFVSRFLDEVPQNERGALIAEDGVSLSAEGVRRVSNAVFSAAYGDLDPGVVRRFAEGVDDNSRAIVGAMSDVAGRWAQMRRAISNGEVSPEFDQTAELTQALRLLGGWREQAAKEGRPVAAVIREGIGQLDLLSGSISPEAQVFLRMFYANDTFTKTVGRDVLAGRLGKVIESTLDLGRPQLFGDAASVSKTEVLRGAVRDNIGADASPLDGAQPGADAIGGVGEGRAAEVAGAGNRPAVEPGAGADPASIAAHVASVADLKRSQPARTIDELYVVAPAHQKTLGEAGEALAEAYNAEWRDPGIKARETTEQKMVRKGYETTAELTDVVRGGFVVSTPASADSIVADLAKRFTIVDEGWQVTAAGYFDRKVLVQFPDGTVGEVQIWHPDMFQAKETTGHQLYEQMRGLKPDDPKFVELLAEQRALYASAINNADQDWRALAEGLASGSEGGIPASGNAARNASADMGSPESMISAASASRQSPPEAGRNQAELPLMTAGLDSQSKNVMSMSPVVGRPVVDMQEPRPAPVPEGLDSAAARVGKPEDVKALAEQFGVDETGGFVEQADIDQLRIEGRITPEDEAALAAADQTYFNAEAYAETLRVAAACMF